MINKFVLIVFSYLLFVGCGEKGHRNIGVIINSEGKHLVNGLYVSYLEVKRNDEGGFEAVVW